MASGHGGGGLPAALPAFTFMAWDPKGGGFEEFSCDFQLSTSRIYGGEEIGPRMGAGVYVDNGDTGASIGIALCVEYQLEKEVLAQMMALIARGAAMGQVFGGRGSPRVIPPLRNQDPNVSAANNRCGGAHALFGFFPAGELENVDIELPALWGGKKPPGGGDDK